MGRSSDGETVRAEGLRIFVQSKGLAPRGFRVGSSCECAKGRWSIGIKQRRSRADSQPQRLRRSKDGRVIREHLMSIDHYRTVSASAGDGFEVSDISEFQPPLPLGL